MLNETDFVNIDRELAARSLSDFISMSWPVIDAEVYQDNWHMDVVSDHLMACHSGEINRLLINVPPGTSKSSAASVFFPAWLWGPGGAPHSRYIGAAHEQGLATRDNRRTRLLIESEWYQRRWPTKITSDQNEKTNFENNKGGFRQSSAVAGMTGKRGHFVTWDDPINPEGSESDTTRETAVRIFKETLTSRLVNPKTSVIIIIMQRLHEDDVAGHILASDYGYHHVMLPMEFEVERRCYSVVKPSWMDVKPVMARYDAAHQRWYLEGEAVDADRRQVIESKPVQEVYLQDPREADGDLLFEDRFSREVVERDKRVMGSYATAGQLQQRPTPRGGGMFHREWFMPVRAAPNCVRYVRGWDIAASTERDSAYTAGVLIGETRDGDYVIIDVVRDQLSDAGVKRLMRSTAAADFQKYGGRVMGSVPQDPGAGGKVWAQQLIKACAGFNYRSSSESGDKVTRASPVSAQAEAGNVMIVLGDWNKDYLEELSLFPFGKFKDQVDATSRAFMEISKPQGVALTGTQS
ncbi:phage terminase large subunit [Roseovarius sp. MMSF_3281]|uniref:phage terminase large subunit n=1 Tax=Roseovarius sp. MMSF_3281 TaxID=3046694 RepID=UPI00273DC2AC|nr:phage terminase large subunit [Roseovarius sp. MMSF_3281]